MVRILGGAGPRFELAADGSDVGETALAGALIEPELQRELGHREQAELLRGGVSGLGGGHSAIIARGCDTVGG
jgi:hypothetical protein